MIRRMKLHSAAVLAGLATGVLGAWLVKNPAGLQALGFRTTGAAAPAGEAAAARTREGSAATGDGTRTGGQPAAAPTFQSLLALLDPDHPAETNARLCRVIGTLPPDLVAAFAKQAELLPDTRGKYLLTGPLGERWAEVAPAEAVAWCFSHGKYNRGLQKVAAQDLAAAEQLFLQCPPTHQLSAWNSLLAGLAEFDPRAALRRAAGPMPDGSPSNQMGKWTVYYHWARTDPAGAAASLPEIASKTDRQQVQTTIIQEWVRTDPAAALAWLRATGAEPGTDHEALKYLAKTDPSTALAGVNGKFSSFPGADLLIYNAWQKNPATVMATLESLTDPAERLAFQKALIPVMAGTDPQQARSLPGFISDPDDRQKAVGFIAAALGRDDPAGAAQWYLENSSGSIFGDPRPMLDLAHAYAAHAPGAALEWSEKLQPQDRSTVQGSVLRQWAVQDPAAAVAAVSAMADPDRRAQCSAALAEAWAQTAPAAALAYARTLEGDVRQRALLGMAQGASHMTAGNRQAGREAVPEVLRSPVTDETMVQQAVSSIYSLIYNNYHEPDIPRTSADWIASLPGGQVREQALQQHLASWCSADSMAASRWVQAQPPGEARDQAASELVNQIAPKDPASAFVWAADIQEPDQRSRRLLETVQLWQKTNPQAALQAIEASGLSAAEKSTLMEAASPGP